MSAKVFAPCRVCRRLRLLWEAKTVTVSWIVHNNLLIDQVFFVGTHLISFFPGWDKHLISTVKHKVVEFSEGTARKSDSRTSWRWKETRTRAKNREKAFQWNQTKRSNNSSSHARLLISLLCMQDESYSSLINIQASSGASCRPITTRCCSILTRWH